MHRRPAALMVDLDGTLLGKERISPRVAGAVRAISARLPVSIATGREAADALKFARQLGLTAPQVCDGGATALNPWDGERFWTSALPECRAEAIITDLSRARVPFLATHPGGSVTRLAEIRDWNLTRISALDIDEASADGLVDQFCDDLALRVIKVFLYYNGLWAVDFTPAGVDKGTAARRVAAMLGIDPAQVVGVGDSYNDLPLLEVCGLGIAMGGAPQAVKAAAHYVAPSVDEDGLAVALEELVMPLLEVRSGTLP